MRKQFFTALLILTFILAHSPVLLSSPVIYKVDIKKEIGPTTWIYLQKALQEAQQSEAEQVLIHLNTFGGGLAEADSMRTAVLYSSIPVSVFIDNNAASAGALISIACKNIYMREGASIGAATVVNGEGEPLPDKYQSYMRALMRSTAATHGKDSTENWLRDPSIAEAMVLDSINGRVLTLTAGEAIEKGFCDGIASTIDEVITKHMGYSDYELKSFEPSVWDNLKGFLSSPYLQAVLIMIIVGGIYFELQSPGIGFPLLAAVAAAVLYFAPLYIDGLALYWEIILFALGVLLIILEIFVIPGFGITGILGIVFLFAGLMLSLLDNTGFNFSLSTGRDILAAFVTVGFGIIGSIALMFFLSDRIGRDGMFKRLALTADQEGFQGTPDEPAKVVGLTGVALTDLRPAGKIEVEGEQYDAVSERVFVEKGKQVKVLRYSIGQLYVEPVEG